MSLSSILRGAALAAGALVLAGLASSARAEDAPTAQVGKAAPDFTLTDIKGTKHTLSEYTKAGKVVVLEWFNPGCPFVKKHHQHNRTMAETYAKYKEQVVWIAINSGAPGKQGTGLERNQQAVTDWGIEYPVCLDESGQVGRMYGAKVTPHMFIVDAQGVVAFNGAIDNKAAPRELGELNYVDQALGALLAGNPIQTAECRPYGCSVKYERRMN